MPNTPKSLVVIPTYNESGNILKLLKQVRSEVPQLDILVVDDSSPDGTGEIVKKHKENDKALHLLTRKSKDGLAAAYIAGFHWGLDRGYEQLVQMDADFSHDPRDLARFLEGLKDNDVIIGCRYMFGGRISGWGVIRHLISRGGNLYAQTILRLPYQDMTGGFNGWSARVLRTIDIDAIRSRGYAYQVEMKYRAHSAGFRIREIPIHFKNRLEGKSKMSGNIIWEAAYRVIEMKTASWQRSLREVHP